MSSSNLYFLKVILATLLGLGLCAVAESRGAETVPSFSGERAMELLVQQCDLGPRTPGSQGNLQLRELIMELGRNHGLAATPLCFTAQNPMGSDPVELCNIVVSAGPAGGDRLWLGAHFDTRPICDKDPDPTKRNQPLVGANDGASGVAVLLHLMEIFAQQAPARGVDLIFFDGEDSGSAGKPQEFCLGSSHLARTWQDFGSPLATGHPEGLIILDMIGDRDLAIPMEQYSYRYSRELVDMVFERAANLNLEAFVREKGPAVYDDHVPFIQAGIAAIDLIDFDYSLWHTTGDTPEACSAASLSQVGTLMVDLLYRP